MSYIKVGLSGQMRCEILALGAQSKSSFCFIKGSSAYLSEPDGNLANLKNLGLFERRIKRLQTKLKARPEIVTCDLHPEYISTKLANKWVKGRGCRVKAVQHHKAHVASCIVDNKINGDIIGVAFDGTGLGLDGNIWGGEFFVGTIKGFKRAAHLQYIPMPGGEASIRQPWRMAFSYLYNVYGRAVKRLKINFLKKLDKDKIGLLIQILDKGINSPLSSSVGRLFDAVSSLAGIRDIAEYEAQAAIELEKAIRARDSQCKYNFSYKDKNGIIVIDWAPVIKGIVKDLQDKKSKSEISIKFHNAVCYMIKNTCNLLRKRYKINNVCMSGGVFQNKYLTNRISPLLKKDRFRVYLHKNIPAHDGNIALGQAAIVAAAKD